MALPLYGFTASKQRSTAQSKRFTALRLYSSMAAFTLVELILYVALVGILLTAAAIFATDVVLGSIKGRVRAQVQSEARFALEKMRQEIVKAKQILSSVWVISASNNTLGKFDVLTGSQIGNNIATNTAPLDISYDYKQNAVWVTTDSNPDTIQKFSASTGSQIGSNIAADSTNFIIMGQPSGITYDPTQNAVWVVNTGFVEPSKIQKINAVNGIQIGGSIDTDFSSTDAIYDQKNNAVWVISGSLRDLIKYNASTGAFISVSRTGNGAAGVAYDPTQDAVWVVNYNSNTLEKFNASDGALINTINTNTTGTRGVVYDNKQNAVWVISYGSNVLQRFDASSGTQIGGNINTGNNPINLAYDVSNNIILVVSSVGIQKFDATTGNLINSNIIMSAVPTNLAIGHNCRFLLPDNTNQIAIAINGSATAQNILQICSKSGSACTSADPWQDLTSPEVEVTNFVCQNISSGTSLGEEAVKIQMTLKNKNPGGKKEFDAEVTVETSISLRL